MAYEHIEKRLTKLMNDDDTPIGLYRFATRLSGLIPHLRAAAAAVSHIDIESTGLAFYRSKVALMDGATGQPVTDAQGNPMSQKARGTLFELEALSRVYKETVDEDVFEAVLDAFKELEDGLGRIDYHDAFKDESRGLDAPKEVVGYFTGGYHAELQNLTKRLSDSVWLDDSDDGIMAALLDELEEVDWPGEKKDRKKTISFLCKALEKVTEKGETLDFDDLENGVHEFRRAIRWMMIYPKGLAGMIDLVGKDALIPELQTYFTDDIVNSPYNQFPTTARAQKTIGFQASYVYAFSSVIGQIGDLKDDGQLEHALTEAFVRTGAATEHDAHSRIRDLVGPERTALSEIADRVRQMVDVLLHECRVTQRMMTDLEDQR